MNHLSPLNNNNNNNVTNHSQEEQVILPSPRVLELQGRDLNTRLSGYFSVHSTNRSSTHSTLLESALEAIHPSLNPNQPSRGSLNLSLPIPPINKLEDNIHFKQLKEWVFEPTPQGEKIYCRIIRRRDKHLGLVYDLYQEDNVYLLSACRKRRGKGAYYVIGILPFDKEKHILAKVKSNFMGTAFTIYDHGISPLKVKRNNRILPNFTKDELKDESKLRQELGAVFYEPNILGFKGPRKMTVLLMGMTSNGTRPEYRPVNPQDTLIEKYRTQSDPNLLVLKNKAPQWNEESQSYVLNFNGRVTLASVKNFQIVHNFDLDYIVLQFGRISKHSFTLDFQFPLCPIQAFAIALSSFDAKLACE